MPEDNATECGRQGAQRGERFGAVGLVQGHTVPSRQLPRRLAGGRGMAVAGADAVQDPRDAGWGMGDGDAAVREETGGSASQTRDPPAVSDKSRGDPHTHDHRRPSQGAHRECEPGGGPTGAERQHDGVGGGGQRAWGGGAPRGADPSPPIVTHPVPAGSPMRRNSRPRTLLPPPRVDERSSRLSHSSAHPAAAAKSGRTSAGVGQPPRLHGARAPRIFRESSIGSMTMRVSTDYIRHAARAARKCGGDPFGGAPQPPDTEFYKTLAKALEEIATALEQLSKEE